MAWSGDEGYRPLDRRAWLPSSKSKSRVDRPHVRLGVDDRGTAGAGSRAIRFSTKEFLDEGLGRSRPPLVALSAKPLIACARPKLDQSFERRARSRSSLSALSCRSPRPAGRPGRPQLSRSEAHDPAAVFSLTSRHVIRKTHYWVFMLIFFQAVDRGSKEQV